MSLLCLPPEILLDVLSYLTAAPLLSLLHTHPCFGVSLIQPQHAIPSTPFAISALFAAVITQDTARIHLLLTHGPPVLIWSSDPRPRLLHRCPGPYTPEIVTHTLTVGAALVLSPPGKRAHYCTHYTRCTALQWSIHRRQLWTTRWLLSLGTDPNATVPAASARFIAHPPLHLAIRTGHIELVRVLLLEARPPASVHRESKHTPLELAASLGAAEISRLLLFHGARAEAGSNRKMTPLGYAAVRGCLETVQLFLKHDQSTQGALVALVRHLTLYPWWEVPESEKGPHAPATAVFKGDWEQVLRLLLQGQGVDVDSLDWRKWSVRSIMQMEPPEIFSRRHPEVVGNMDGMRRVFRNICGGDWGGGPMG